MADNPTAIRSNSRRPLCVLLRWRQTLLKQGYAAPICWSHRYKNYTFVITIWLISTKYPYLKWQWSFYFLCRCLFPPSLPILLPTWLYIWVTRRVSYKKHDLLTLREHLSSLPGFFVGSVLLIFLDFCVVFVFIMSPKRNLGDILCLLRFLLFFLLLFFFLPPKVCPTHFSEMPWSNFMKPCRNIICHVKLRL